MIGLVKYTIFIRQMRSFINCCIRALNLPSPRFPFGVSLFYVWSVPHLVAKNIFNRVQHVIGYSGNPFGAAAPLIVMHRLGKLSAHRIEFDIFDAIKEIIFVLNNHAFKSALP